MNETLFLPAGDSAVNVEFGRTIDPEINKKIRGLSDSLSRKPIRGEESFQYPRLLRRRVRRGYSLCRVPCRAHRAGGHRYTHGQRLSYLHARIPAWLCLSRRYGQTPAHSAPVKPANKYSCGFRRHRRRADRNISARVSRPARSRYSIVQATIYASSPSMNRSIAALKSSSAATNTSAE